MGNRIALPFVFFRLSFYFLLAIRLTLVSGCRAAYHLDRHLQALEPHSFTTMGVFFFPRHVVVLTLTAIDGHGDNRRVMAFLRRSPKIGMLQRWNADLMGKWKNG
nr:hypothetical protein [Deltaproteobacteria bacterium]